VAERDIIPPLCVSRRLQQFNLRARAKALFDRNPTVRCPYFGSDVVLNADGFHHLRYSARRERSKREQMLKLGLLPLGLEVIRKSGTVQEYRRIWQPGKPGPDGMRPAKEVDYWGFVAIIGPRPDKIRVILRRVGIGNITFWSAIRVAKVISNGSQKLAPDGLEGD